MIPLLTPFASDPEEEEEDESTTTLIQTYVLPYPTASWSIPLASAQSMLSSMLTMPPPTFTHTPTDPGLTTYVPTQTVSYPSPVATFISPTISCYAGTTSGQYSFDGPAALDYINDGTFCSNFFSEQGTYQQTVEFDNGGNSVMFSAVMSCFDVTDMYQCQDIMSNFINLCEYICHVCCTWFLTKGYRR